MCNISNKIKLCSCKSNSPNKLKHYWLMYRRNKDKNEIIVGQMLLPDEAVTLHFESNYCTLENRLKEPDAFDFVVDCKTGDILEIVMDNDNDSIRTVYGFKYNKKQWNRFEINTFELMGCFDEIGFGKIKNR